MKRPKRISLKEARKLVDFGVITIKAEEFAAVLRRFPPELEAHGETQYNLARFNDNTGTSRCVAVVRSWEQGDIPAQSIAHALITDLQPRCILIVGIAGARPEKEFTLGDVIVANRMLNFSVTAANADGTEEYATRCAPAHRLAEIVASSLVADAQKYGDWRTETSIGMPRPPVDLSSSNIKGSPAWRKKVREALGHYFGKKGHDRQPIVVDGPIGSSSTLMKDPERFANWLDKTREVKAVDMEISGVYEAARSTSGDLPVIAIRGLSDIVGFKRDARWTEYACQTAASFCFGLLRSGVLDFAARTRSRQPVIGQLQDLQAINGETGSRAPPKRKRAKKDNATTAKKAVEEWLLGLLEQSPEDRPSFTLQAKTAPLLVSC